MIVAFIRAHFPAQKEQPARDIPGSYRYLEGQGGLRPFSLAVQINPQADTE